MTYEEDQQMILNTEKKMSYNEGQNDSKLEIAKKMLQMKTDIDFISKATGLSNEEILKLQ